MGLCSDDHWGQSRLEGLKPLRPTMVWTFGSLGRLDHDSVIEEASSAALIYLHTSVKESFSFALLEAKLAGLSTCAYQGLPGSLGIYRCAGWIISRSMIGVALLPILDPLPEPFDGSRYVRCDDK